VLTGSSAVCFSFYPTKNMTTIEGGMICTNDDFLAGKLMLLRMHGMDKDAWKRFSHKGKWDYDIQLNGFKMNMNDIQASLGLTQLKKLDQMNRKRDEIAVLYNRLLDVRGFNILDSNKVWHIYPVFVKNRDQLMKKLNNAGIGTSVFFKTINKHTAFKHLKGKFPIADHFYKNSLCLPLYPDLTLKQVKHICKQVNKYTGVNAK
jgi:dTDP-4-amino-4,6-dideoxygalactose transaminase